MRVVIFLLFLSVLMPHSFAGAAASRYQIGVLSCPTKVELLDYYEGRLLRGLEYSSHLTILDVLGNFRSRMPDRADFLQILAADFEQKRQASPNLDLGVMAAKDLILQNPPDCQTVVLLSTDFEKKFEINQNLWASLSVADQAGVIANWALAAEVFQSRQTLPPGSLYIRTLNSLLPVSRIHEMTLTELIQLLRAAGLPSLRQQGVLVDLNQELHIQNQLLRLAFPMAGSTWTYHPPAGQKAVKQTLRLKSSRIVFHANGSVQSLRFEDRLFISTPGGLLPFETPDDFSRSIRFFEDGNINTGSVFQPVLYQTSRIRVRLAQGRDPGQTVNSSYLSFKYPGCLFTNEMFVSNNEIYKDDPLNCYIDNISHVSGLVRLAESWIEVKPNSSIALWRDKNTFLEVSPVQPFEYKEQGKNLSWRGHTLFFPDGKIACGVLDKAAVLKLTKKYELVQKGQRVCFLPQYEFPNNEPPGTDKEYSCELKSSSAAKWPMFRIIFEKTIARILVVQKKPDGKIKPYTVVRPMPILRDGSLLKVSGHIAEFDPESKKPIREIKDISITSDEKTNTLSVIIGSQSKTEAEFSCIRIKVSP